MQTDHQARVLPVVLTLNKLHFICIEYSSLLDIWLDDSLYARKRKKGMDKFIPEKRKRPVTVSGIFIPICLYFSCLLISLFWQIRSNYYASFYVITKYFLLLQTMRTFLNILRDFCSNARQNLKCQIMTEC